MTTSFTLQLPRPLRAGARSSHEEDIHCDVRRRWLRRGKRFLLRALARLGAPRNHNQGELLAQSAPDGIYCVPARRRLRGQHEQEVETLSLLIRLWIEMHAERADVHLIVEQMPPWVQ